MRLRQNTAIAAIPTVLQRRFDLFGRISPRIKVRVAHVMDLMGRGAVPSAEILRRDSSDPPRCQRNVTYYKI